ncbi:MAG: hypothetical protein ABF743_00630 [Schleiferilactobacillus perolens]|uniref:hypothetical protein n=1 Tax=Schleiferilactobacillus perolens TaxID=100468 RepID=UPI0039EA6EE4
MANASYLQIKQAFRELDKNGKGAKQSAAARKKDLMAAFIKRTTGPAAAPKPVASATPATAAPKRQKKNTQRQSVRNPQEIYRLKHQLATTKQRTADQQKQITQLQDQLTAEQGKITHWHQQIRQLTNQHLQMQTTTTRLHRTIQSLQQKNANRSKTIKKLRWELQAWRNRTNRLQQENRQLRGQWIAKNQTEYVATYQLWQKEQSPYRILRDEVIPHLQNEITELQNTIADLNQTIKAGQYRYDLLLQVFDHEAQWRPSRDVAEELFAPLVSRQQMARIKKILAQGYKEGVPTTRPSWRPATVPLTDAARVQVTQPTETGNPLFKELLAQTTPAAAAPKSKKTVHLALDRYSAVHHVRPQKTKQPTVFTTPDWLENATVFQDIPIYVFTWQDAKGIRNQLTQLGAIVQIIRPDAISLNQIHAIAYSQPDAIMITDRTKAHHATVQAMKDIQADPTANHAVAVIADRGIGLTSTLRTIYDILMGRWSRSQALFNRETPSVDRNH